MVYKELDVWKHSVSHVKKIYEASPKSQSEEIYGLTSQI